MELAAGAIIQKIPLNVFFDYKELIQENGHSLSDASKKLEQDSLSSDDYQSILSEIDAILSE